MFARTKRVEIDGFDFEVHALTLDESADWFGKTLDTQTTNRKIMASSVHYDGAPLGERVGQLTIALMTKLLPHVLEVNGLEAPATVTPAPASPNGHDAAAPKA